MDFSGLQNGISYFPVGTLAVNVLGSFFLSLTMYLSEYHGLFGEETRIFLTIGFLGSFTTMSTFSYETFKLLENKEINLFIINITATLALTLLGVYLGKMVALWRR